MQEGGFFLVELVLVWSEGEAVVGKWRWEGMESLYLLPWGFSRGVDGLPGVFLLAEFYTCNFGSLQLRGICIAGMQSWPRKVIRGL